MTSKHEDKRKCRTEARSISTDFAFFFPKYKDSFHRFENDCFISFVIVWGKRVGNIKERLPLLWHRKSDKHMRNKRKILLSKLHTEEIQCPQFLQLSAQFSLALCKRKYIYAKKPDCNHVFLLPLVKHYQLHKYTVKRCLVISNSSKYQPVQLSSTKHA